MKSGYRFISRNTASEPHQDAKRQAPLSDADHFEAGYRIVIAVLSDDWDALDDRCGRHERVKDRQFPAARSEISRDAGECATYLGIDGQGVPCRPGGRPR